MVNRNTSSVIIRENIFIILLKVTVLAFLGSTLMFTFSLVIKAFAALSIIVIFLNTIKKRDFLSVLLQLFICNHFVFYPQFGGLYNLLFIVSLLIFFISGKKQGIYFNSSFSTTIKWSLIGLLIFQILSVIGGNDFDTSKKIIAIFTFLVLIYIFYFSSLLEISNKDYLRFLNVICIFFIYMLFVSLNQKYLLITSIASHNPFFPSYDDTTIFELDITRSSGTFQNYETYAEYSLSIIALLLPAVLSGSLKRINTGLYFLSILTIFCAVFSIVLSGTRSSIILLPVLIFIIIYYIKTIKVNSLLFISFFIGLFLIGNSFFKVVDFSVFSKRSKDISFNNLSFSKILSGEEINRVAPFQIGIENINKNGGFIGGGYFTSPEEYRGVHYKNDLTEYYSDYHNLYLSIIVVWGFVGAFLFLSIILSLYFKGVRLYRKVKRNSSLPNDLLLGFNAMFILFLINEFKIQFNREVNYFMVVLILLAIYSSLIKQISQQRIDDITN